MTDDPKDSFWSAARGTGLLEAVFEVGKSLCLLADKDTDSLDKVIGLFSSCMSLTASIGNFLVQLDIAHLKRKMAASELLPAPQPPNFD